MTSRETRASKELHTHREDETRADLWQPPAVLDAPPAREGFRQRWVSTSILGVEVPHHTVRRLREGWVPRSKDTVAKDFPVPTIAHGQYEGFIGVEGMILCELPEERALARERYFAGKTGDLNKYVDNNLNRLEAAGGPSVDRSDSASSFSRGPGRVAAD